MSLTYDIPGLGTTTTSINVERSNEALWIPISGPTYDPNSRWTTMVYESTAAPEGRSPRFTLKTQLVTAKGGASMRNVRVEYTAYSVVTNSVDGSEIVQPVDAAITLRIPAGLHEVADVDKLIANLYGVLFPSVTAGARNLDRLGGLLRGSVRIV